MCFLCGKCLLWVFVDVFWVVCCNWQNKCVVEFYVKELYFDFFVFWSDCYVKMLEVFYVVVDVYMCDVCGFDLVCVVGWYM